MLKHLPSFYYFFLYFLRNIIVMIAVAITEITFAVIPGVAFDHTGNRLGRGKGYYDRLLPHLSKAFKVGICFPYQLIETIPTEPFDIPMDSVITIE